MNYLMSVWRVIRPGDIVYYKRSKGKIFKKGRRLFIKFADSRVRPVKQFAYSSSQRTLLENASS